jgi:hypothetical protein
MTVEVRFGKNRYHQHKEMIDWCSESLGPGGWTYDTPKDWTAWGGQWAIHCTFGNTVFAFKEEKDASMFILRWEWQNAPQVV